MADRIVGEIPGVAPGTAFPTRRALREAGVHRVDQAGIVGRENEGAESIVVSGGYEDDEDFGSMIVYTGHGGRDPRTGAQVAHQELHRGNMALAVSCAEGLPVRVIRGSGGDSAISPPTGFRYDGLYYVEDFWSEIGQSSYIVWRFRLVAERPDGSWGTLAPETAAPRTPGVVQRIVRNTELSQRVKVLYEHHCQICEAAIQTRVGPYAEGAHIRPLGRPHNGPDVLGNLLCLCPNDHVRLEHGGITLSDDFVVLDRFVGPSKRIAVHRQHPVDVAFVRYQRRLFDGPSTA